MDLCHRDGSLKQAVAKDPAKYIHEDKRLAGIMEMYRAAGKKLFVATNSLWDYTHVVMNFLKISGRVGNQRNEDWLEYFDVVITGIGLMQTRRRCCLKCFRSLKMEQQQFDVESVGLAYTAHSLVGAKFVFDALSNAFQSHKVLWRTHTDVHCIKVPAALSNKCTLFIS